MVLIPQNLVVNQLIRIVLLLELHLIQKKLMYQLFFSYSNVVAIPRKIFKYISTI